MQWCDKRLDSINVAGRSRYIHIRGEYAMATSVTTIISALQAHDTTSAAMNWFLNLMGNHPAVQARVQQEVDEVLGADETHDVTFDDLGKLRYLEACFKETLRLYPSVPLIARQMTEDTRVSKWLLMMIGQLETDN